MNLAELDCEWSQRLRSDRCPAILGLAPLSEDDCARVSALVRERLPAFLGQGGPLYVFLKLLRDHGAVLAVWLARQAGVAYDGGFWERFEKEIGFPVPAADRRHFANEFRRAGARCMVNHTAPEEGGGRKYVGEFLYQAGLPLHHCETFAGLLRQCEARFGLPDPDEPEAAGDLRGQMLDRLGSLPQPTLRRALAGPAGPALCGAALRVVFEGRFDEINPRLGEELARAFQPPPGQKGGGLRRAARPPFLRLAADLCGLEIVGPSQDPAHVGPGGVHWVFNGVAERAPVGEDFVRAVRSPEPVAAELRGLRAGVAAAARRFVFRLEDAEEPFRLFDAASRRHLTLGVGTGKARSLRSGRYYLLHGAGAPLLGPGAGERMDWPDGAGGAQTLSVLEIRPGTRFELAGGWTFGADRHPFLEPEGSALAAEDGGRIHYGWRGLPAVWLPAETLPDGGAGESGWRLEVRVENLQESWLLRAAGGVEVGGMRRCAAAGAEGFLQGLRPGLRRVEATVFFGARRQAAEVYPLWIGLRAADPAGERFDLSAFPANLRQEGCAGFDFAPDGIRRAAGAGRRGTLAFARADGGSEEFRWERAGTFLESFECGAGRGAEPRPHALGERFAASAASRRELRIWPLAGVDAELWVNGELRLRRPAGHGGARHLDVSLANLAMLYPQGGTLRLRAAPLPGGEMELASFVPPLTLEGAALASAAPEAEAAFTLRFAEAPGGARPLLRDLLAPAGEPVRFEPPDPEPDGTRVFRAEGLPALILATEDAGRTLRWTLPRTGWPLGLWHFECQVRREAAGEWQAAADAGGRPAPALLPGGTDGGDPEPPADWPPRARLLWTAACRHGRASVEAMLPGADDALDLLTEVTAWTRRGCAPGLRAGLAWLDELRGALVARVAAQLGGVPPMEEGWTDRLLHLACREEEDGGLFVRVPGLLALRAGLYRQVPAHSALARALRWCAGLAAQGRIADGLWAQTLRLDFETLGCFKNFARLARLLNADADAAAEEDFAGFDFPQFWRGLPNPVPAPAPDDWDEEAPLGAAHWNWAVGQLIGRYERDDAPLGAINGLLTAAPAFWSWLRLRLGAPGGVLLAAAGSQPWPKLQYPKSDFVENCPRFASLLALAARAAARGWLPFGEVAGWLSGRSAGAEALPIFVQLAPELFGHQLMFWELMLQSHARAAVPAAHRVPL